ncbi:RrF2 family transcriptional regulator [Gemella cuniculi]|uniref:RrF2 family transcriptional regulator n=1 Tax=Gemella cuniculi TaxID=150240 RepID=UPI000403BC05|nr:Rrf2 family transcriptional regulator [Gemella cuniculi]
MKLNKSLEQATYVITMLALQKEHKPIKSHILSQVLQVSDSYLKKVLNKLSKAGLVSSNASKIGGYQLAKPVNDITLKDIFFALEIHADVLEFKHIAHQVYEEEEHVYEAENKVKTTLENGLEAFYKELETLKISDLLQKDVYENGVIDWNDKYR